MLFEESKRLRGQLSSYSYISFTVIYHFAPRFVKLEMKEPNPVVGVVGKGFQDPVGFDRIVVHCATTAKKRFGYDGLCAVAWLISKRFLDANLLLLA